jgi:hypothetical protein
LDYLISSVGITEVEFTVVQKPNLPDYATQAGFAYFFDKVAHQALGMEKK